MASASTLQKSPFTSKSDKIKIKQFKKQTQQKILSTLKKIMQRQKGSSSLKCNKFNFDSTCVDDGQESKLNSTETNNTPFKKQHQRSAFRNYSKCKSQMSISKQDKREYLHRNHSTLQTHFQKNNKCIKHMSWFNNCQTYPFKPQITSSLPYNIYPEKQNINLYNISKEQKYQRLIENLRNKHLSRMEQKIMRDKKQMQIDCSFIPNKEKNQSPQPNPQIHEKLFQESKQIIKSKKINQQEKVSKQNKQIEECKKQAQNRYEHNKSKWEMLLNSEKHKDQFQKPIYQRIKSVTDYKKSLINSLRLKHQQSYFQNQVKLNPQKSQELVKRLIDDYLKQKEVSNASIQQVNKVEFQLKHPFKPQLNINNLYCRRDFIRSQEPSKQIKSTQCLTFHPKIDQTSSIIVKKLKLRSDQENNFTKYQNFADRLYYGGVEEKTIKLQNISTQIYRQCTFSPEINIVSKQLTYLKEKNEQNTLHHKCSLPQSVVLEQRQLTFQPQINFQSKCMSLPQKQQVLIKNKQKSKQKAQTLQNEKQYKQMQECTFRPKTISTSSEWKKWKHNFLKQARLAKQIQLNRKADLKQNIQKEQSIKGITVYLKNCERIKLKKQSHQDRMNEIFNFSKKYDERIKKESTKIKQKQQEI